MIRDAAGNLYGTTEYGGANTGANGGLGGGTVFKLDTTGNETVLYSFCSAANCADGEQPTSSLVLDAEGNLYGTTRFGGANTSADGGQGGGTVFKVESTGHEAVLYSFCSAANCTDGDTPYFDGVIRDSAGNLYGTTLGGGANNVGVVFKVDDTGQETVLYSFCSLVGCTDGTFPYNDALVRDGFGNLYGATSGNGYGKLFKLDSTGHESVLYTFSGYNGNGPENLLASGGGGLYGVTTGGGSGHFGSGGRAGGTVFRWATCTTSGCPATVKLTSSMNPSHVGQSVTFSAAVSGAWAAPTGSVTFKEGTTAIGTVTLAHGKASLTTTFTKSGTFSIVASYSGDKNYKATAVSIKQVVDP